jgi:hypothetical protein
MWDYLFNNFWCLNTVTRWHLLSLSSFYPLITSSIIESKLVKGKWKLEESRSTYCWVQSYCKEESRTSLHRLQIIIVKSSKRKKKKKNRCLKNKTNHVALSCLCCLCCLYIWLLTLFDSIMSCLPSLPLLPSLYIEVTFWTTMLLL